MGKFKESKRMSIDVDKIITQLVKLELPKESEV